MGNVQQHRIQRILGDGARASKFDVQVIMPNSSSFQDDEAISVLAKTASFPGKSHEIIDFKYKGRTLPIRGQTKYSQTWECTFYLTEEHSVKRAMEQWLEAIDQKHNYDTPQNLGAGALQSEFSSGDWTSNIIVYQKNFDAHKTTTQYTLLHAFPIDIQEVQVQSDSVNTISEFTVTFAYSHYLTSEVHGSSTGVSSTDMRSVFMQSKIQSAQSSSGASGDPFSSFMSSMKRSLLGDVEYALENLISKLI